MFVHTNVLLIYSCFLIIQVMMIVKATSVLISPNILSGNQTLELIKVVLIPDNKYGLVIHYLHTPYSLHVHTVFIQTIAVA